MVSLNWKKPLALAPKDYLLRAHTRSEHCFVVLDGMMIRERSLDNGRRQIVGLHVPGDVCGLAALSDGEVDHDTIALSAVSCVPIARRWVSSLAADSRELSQIIWREMSREMAMSAAWIVNLGQRPAHQRMAHFLCELGARLGAASRTADAAFEWPGTQADFSAITGLSVVHVNRTLKRLKSESLLSCGRRLRVTDTARLCALARFDPTYLALDRPALGEALLSRMADLDTFVGDEAFRSVAEHQILAH